MLGRIDSRELAEWMAFYRIDPWGGQRTDIGAAVVASTVANVNRGKGRSFTPSDFMPRFGRKAVQSQEGMKAAFRAFAARCNNGDNRKT